MLITLINSDLLSVIIDYLSPYDIYQLLHILKSKKLNQYFKLLLGKIVIIKQLRHITYQYPFLKFKSYFLGATGYLDGITHKNLSHSIMIGYDTYNRWFISVKYKCVQNWSFDGNLIKKTDKKNCLTIFQRYPNGNSWYQCGQASKLYNAPLLYSCPVCLNDNDLDLFTQNISRLVNQRPIIYYDYINKYSMTPTVKKLVMCQLII